MVPSRSVRSDVPGSDSILKTRFTLRERATWLFGRVQVHTRPLLLRAAAARLLARALPAAARPLDAYEGALAGRLAADIERAGYAYVPQPLTSQQLDEILYFVRDQPCFEPSQPLAPFTHDTPPPAAVLGHYNAATILAAPHLLALANDPRILATAAAYLGCKPTISNISLWWSFSHEQPARDAQLFHRDRDDWKFCKLFLYLTDVDERSGPHVFVEGSHRVAQPSGLRRFSDDEIQSRFPATAIKHFCMPRGSAFLLDTFGIHKGLPPSDGRRRLLFQVEYSLLPIFHYEYAPVARCEIAATLVPKLDPYINRLLVHEPAATRNPRA